MGKAAYHYRELTHTQVAGSTVLSCLKLDGGAKSECLAFFKTGLAEKDLKAGAQTKITNARSVGNGLIVNLAYEGEAPAVKVNGEERRLPLEPQELDTFAALNVMLAVRNGETAQATLEWLRYHAAQHNLQGAVILDRAEPGKDTAYLEELEAGASVIAGLKQVMVVRVDAPLGALDLPAEAHPYNAPDAPGKDRMDIPPPSPWDSPLAELQLIEMIRYRWLNAARAVALLDISDLVMQIKGKGTKGRTLFDMAVKSTSGVVTLVGQHCYPWRVRNDEPVRHGDHICVQFDAAKLRRRWVVAPQKSGSDVVWRLIRVVGAKPEADEWVKFYRCMGLRHPTDTVGQIVPKTSLIEEAELIKLSKKKFDHKPIRMPEIPAPKVNPADNDVAIITCMKNEGPFILEWLAYHRAIGVKDVLVYTNDCNDGTDTFLELLQEKRWS